MLVLSRSQNEEVLIGDDICVTVVRIDGESVRLGFQAPVDVPIYRRELYEDIHGRKESDSE